MRINCRKIRKILGRIRKTPKHIFETFCTQETPRCIGMNATHITIYLLQKINQGFFPYYISCKDNKCCKSFKIVRKSFLIILSIHILKLEISGCDKTLIQQLGHRKQIEPQRLNNSNTPESDLITYLDLTF
jgi:hypothetical protein